MELFRKIENLRFFSCPDHRPSPRLRALRARVVGARAGPRRPRRLNTLDTLNTLNKLNVVNTLAPPQPAAPPTHAALDMLEKGRLQHRPPFRLGAEGVGADVPREEVWDPPMEQAAHPIL